MTEQEIKKTLRKKLVIEHIIEIANDQTGDNNSKVCSIRDYLLHAITGCWWDEIENFD